MIRNYFLIFLCFTPLISQDLPGTPDIAWMPTEYNLVDGNVDLSISWNMWWGENGHHWKLIQNSVEKFEADIPLNSPQAQHDETNVSIAIA